MTTIRSRTASNVTTRRPQRAEDLVRLSATELDELYAAGKAPSIQGIQGNLSGRVLASPGLGALSTLTGALTPPELFPWRGKTFRATSAAGGEGFNRLLGNVKIAPFKYYLGPSRAGDFKALHLDYGQPGNLWPISHLRDELREIAPGLYLGQAYLEAFGRQTKLVYFALEKA